MTEVRIAEPTRAEARGVDSPVPTPDRELLGACLGCGILVALLVLGLVSSVRPAVADPDAADSLGASSGVPWNPAHPLARRRVWEQILLLPGRIVSLPLVGLGYASDNLLFEMEQSPRFANGTAPFQGSAARHFSLRTAQMGDRTGLGGALEVHDQLGYGALESRVSAEYAATLHGYDRTLLTWSGRPLSLEYGYEWRPMDRFYGVGNATSTGGVSDYASQSEFVRGALSWESRRVPGPERSYSAFGIWAGPRSQVTSDGRGPGDVSYAIRYPDLGASTLDRRVENLVYGARLRLDRRAGAPHWSHGWRALLSEQRFDAPIHALALHSAVDDGARFTRSQAEAEAGFSFMRDPRTVRVLLLMTDQRVDTNRDRLLVSDLSTLGGQAGLAGYEPGRFHDLDRMLARLSYVFPLERHLEMEMHSEWGAVYPDLWTDARFNTLHHSYGFSFRARDDHAPRASFGFDFSSEAVRLRFSLGAAE